MQRAPAGNFAAEGPLQHASSKLSVPVTSPVRKELEEMVEAERL